MPAGTFAQDSDAIFENMIEGYMKGLFRRELSSANRQNMTDCVTRLFCENICHRTVKGEIKGEPLLNTAQMLGRTEADQMGYFFTGGDRGFEYGRQKQCYLCAEKYPNCLSSSYENAKLMSGQYEQSMLKGAESSLSNDFLSFD